MNSFPIGILDSGIGGLTNARAIQELLPNEKIIFYGDTTHLPYGDKSKQSIIGYVLKIGEFLRLHQVKMILIACNSASAAAYNDLVLATPPNIPVLNVIDPIVNHLVKMNQYKKIGIIGTKATIDSRVYPNKFKKKSPDTIVKSLATPLLAPMIEEGFFNNNISQTIVNAYLSNKNLKDIDALILACTHYPLIKKEIDHFYKNSIDIIDSTKVVATEVYRVLKEYQLLNTLEDVEPEHEFFVSDYTSSFEKTTSLFFGKKVKLQLAE